LSISRVDHGQIPFEAEAPWQGKDMEQGPVGHLQSRADEAPHEGQVAFLSAQFESG